MSAIIMFGHPIAVAQLVELCGGVGSVAHVWGANSVHQAVIELYVKAGLSMVPQLRGLLSVYMAIKSGLDGGAGVVFAGGVHMCV